MDVTLGISQNIRETRNKFQLECYLKDPLLCLVERNGVTRIYANLASVALKYLSAPPSSIDSERLFNTAGIVFEKNAAPFHKMWND